MNDKFFALQLAVPQGFVTPGRAVVTTTPSPPKKRRMAIDNVIKLSNEVIKRNVDTKGRETLSERVSKLKYLKRHLIGCVEVSELQRHETQETGEYKAMFILYQIAFAQARNPDRSSGSHTTTVISA